MNHSPISPRERTALALLAEGNQTKQIARGMGISPRTAKQHVENAMVKLNANNRTHLVAIAFRNGILHVLALVMVATPASFLDKQVGRLSRPAPRITRTLRRDA